MFLCVLPPKGRCNSEESFLLDSIFSLTEFLFFPLGNRLWSMYYSILHPHSPTFVLVLVWGLNSVLTLFCTKAWVGSLQKTQKPIKNHENRQWLIFQSQYHVLKILVKKLIIIYSSLSKAKCGWIFYLTWFKWRWAHQCYKGDLGF